MVVIDRFHCTGLLYCQFRAKWATISKYLTSIIVWDYGAARVPFRVVGTRQRRTLAPHACVLRVNASRTTFNTAIFTHSDLVFQGPFRPQLPGIATSVANMIQCTTRCPCPDHLSRRLRRTAVIITLSSVIFKSGYWFQIVIEHGHRWLVDWFASPRGLSGPLLCLCFKQTPTHEACYSVRF